MICRRAFTYSLSKSVPASSLRESLLRFSAQFLTALSVTFVASLLDAVLWTFFAGTFHFQP